MYSSGFPLSGSDPLYGSSSGRDMGLLIYGDLFGKLVNYNLALMNGQGMKDKNNQKDIVGSLMVHPLDCYQLQHGDAQLEGKDFFCRHHVKTERHAAVELVRSLTDGLQHGFLQPFPYLFLMNMGNFSMSGKGNRLCRCLYLRCFLFYHCQFVFTL